MKPARRQDPVRERPAAPGEEGVRDRQGRGPRARCSAASRSSTPTSTRCRRRRKRTRVASSARRSGPRPRRGDAMTIARRILLLAGGDPADPRSRWASSTTSSWPASSRAAGSWRETQVPSLSALGNISRTFEEMRVALRDHLLAPDAGRGGRKARQAFARAPGRARPAAPRSTPTRWCRTTGTGGSLDEFRATSAEWIAAAAEADGAGGRRAGARRRAACWLGAPHGRARARGRATPSASGSRTTRTWPRSAGDAAVASLEERAAAHPAGPGPGRCSCRAASAC